MKKTREINVASINQDICRKLVNREVSACVSMLVSELAGKAELFPEYADDLYSAYTGDPDYEQAARDAGWVEAEENDSTGNNFYREVAGETEDSFADDWRELCEEQGIDADDYRREIYEHWIVSDWFATKLESKGERILRDFFGLTVWGRSTTGQAILLDSVIREIASEMGILHGQENSWEE